MTKIKNEIIVELLKKIPKSPGIYKFKSNSGEIIYVGKSVNLKSRVNSYFNSSSKLNFAKKQMVEKIFDIETILTNTEEEALVLESNLIKKHKPKYNILMKDDKSYLYVKITKEAIPKVLMNRNKATNLKNSSAEYFGPYVNGFYLKNTLQLLKKTFGYRSCNIEFSKNEPVKILAKNGSKIPCIDYYIGRCSAPCLLEKDKIEKYQEGIQNIKEFLNGNTSNIQAKLRQRMFEKAKNLEFEEAQKLKIELESIENLGGYQVIKGHISGDAIVLNFIKKYEKFYIGIIEIEDSKIISYENFEIEFFLEETDEEIIEKFLENYLIEKSGEKKVILPIEINPKNIIFKKSLKAEFEFPKIGGKIDLLKIAYKNIYEFAYKKHLASLSVKGFSKANQANILKIFGYKKINKDLTFECNDISHISGSFTVASRSVIQNGKPEKTLYRKFKLKTLENTEINDFDSMREIFTRRILEIFKTKYIPDLIIIDGGKGQLSSVVGILEDFKNILISGDKENILPNSEEIIKEKEFYLELLNNLQLVSLAKREEEVFMPHQSESILLNKESPELRLFQKIRDEAHRFAITFNRKSRNKSMKANTIEALPGFGPKARKAILKNYGHVNELRNVSESELKKILNKNQIQTLKDHGII